MGSKGSRLSYDITTKLHEDKKANRYCKKLLILGPPKSGKSTLFHQLQGNLDLPHPQRIKHKHRIYKHVIRCMQQILRCLYRTKYRVHFPDVAMEIADMILDIHPETVTTSSPLSLQDTMNYIHILSQQDAVQQIVRNSMTYHLLPSTEYFLRLSNLQRLMECTQYVPSNVDLMQYRLRGRVHHNLSEAEVHIKRTRFVVYDMNSALDSVTNSCTKWMHCFDHVTSLVFVSSLVSYSETIVDEEQHEMDRLKRKIALDALIDSIGEDSVELIMSFLDDTKQGVNAMTEGIKLFGDVVNNKWFGKQPAILMLNKKDLLQQRISNDEECYRFIKCFPEYNGIVNYPECTEYIKQQFLKEDQNDDRYIYTHLISATEDIDIVDRVFNTVQSIVLEQCLRMGNHI